MLTIVFDLDGTLVDTAPDLIDTLNVVLAREGLPGMPFDVARPMIGGGARGLIERALAAEGRTEAKADVDRMFAAFIAHYAAHIADRSRAFPELEPTLDHLAALGHRLAVCTNKLEWLSKRLLSTLNLAGRFAAICGQDTFGVQKPDPQVLRRTILRAGGDPGACHHGRRFRHRRAHRARRRRSGHRRRFWLHGGSDCRIAAGPDHRLL